MPKEVALRKYSSSFQGFGDGELGIGHGTLSSPVGGEACVDFAGDGGGVRRDGVGRILDEWGLAGVGVEESRLALGGRFPSLVVDAQLASRPGPSSVAIVLCGSSQQPAGRNVAWMVSQGM